MSVEEFGQLTFRLFNALVDRQAQREERLDVRNASVVAAIFNTQPGRKKSQMVTVDELLGRKRDSQHKQTVKSSDELKLEVLKLMQIFDGVDRR